MVKKPIADIVSSRLYHDDITRRISPVYLKDISGDSSFRALALLIRVIITIMINNQALSCVQVRFSVVIFSSFFSIYFTKFIRDENNQLSQV